MESVRCTDPATNARTIIVLPTGGGEPRVIMNVPSGVKPEDLSNLNLGQTLGIVKDPDGQSLMIAKIFRDPKRADELWRVPRDGGSPAQGWQVGIAASDTSPDGKQVAFVESDPAAGPFVSIRDNKFSAAGQLRRHTEACVLISLLRNRQ